MDSSTGSTENPSQQLVYCPIDFEMLPIDDFKVLGCGHCFCEKCLLEWRDQKLLNCPKCRTEEIRDVAELSTIKSNTGPLLPDKPPEEEEKLKIRVLVHKQFARRAETIR